MYTLSTDNELPDYIMVMLANNKTVLQINNDLQLFLGDNTDRFTSWLQRAITDPSALMEKETETIPERKYECERGGREEKGSERERERCCTLSVYMKTCVDVDNTV